MTSFVHVEKPASHPGVDRAESLIARLRAARQAFDSVRGLAILLLAAIVSSTLVVADKLINDWNQGGMLAAWIILWVVAFAALAFFAPASRQWAARLVAAGRSAAQRRASARADEQFLSYAKIDARVMRELQAISTRQESAESAASSGIVAKEGNAPGTAVPSLYEAMRQVNLGKHY